MITGHEIHKYLGIGSKDDSCGVYVGFQEIDGHQAATKVGRSKNAQAIQRGRAQGGANWWFTTYFLLPDVDATHKVEREWKELMKSQRIEKTAQRQTELYYLSAKDAANELEQIVRRQGYEVRDLVEEIIYFNQENDIDWSANGPIASDEDLEWWKRGVEKSFKVTMNYSNK